MRFIGFLIKSTFVISVIFLIALGVLLSMGLSDNALYVEKIKITDKEIESVQSFIEKNNPLYFKQGQKKTVSISEKQLALLVKYIQKKVAGEHQVQIKLFNSAAYIVSSIRLPENALLNSFGHYINISASIEKQGNGISIKKLDIGQLPIPDAITEYISKRILIELEKRSIIYQDALDAITGFSFHKKRFDVSFVWNKNIANQVKNNAVTSIFSAEMLQRLNIYTEELNIVVSAIKISKPSLTSLLKPMFTLAYQRSKNNNPILENRALFIVLGAYMLEKNIPKFMGNRQAVKLTFKEFYLTNRNDLSKHFLVSAALTAVADPGIAHAIGLEKEIKDSDGGSGFSFADLAADRAGVTLANTALNSNKYASMVQLRLSKLLHERDFMPDILNLPEGLQKINFSKVYQNTDSEIYQKVIKIIDRRIRSCGIYGN